jgi:hypothetical protein
MVQIVNILARENLSTAQGITQSQKLDVVELLLKTRCGREYPEHVTTRHHFMKL